MAETRLQRLQRHRLVMEIAVTERLSLDDARAELVRRHEQARQRARANVRLDVPAGHAAPPEGAEPRFWWEKY